MRASLVRRCLLPAAGRRAALISRRQFLVLGSAGLSGAAAFAAALSRPGGSVAEAALGGGGPLSLSVGYWVPSEHLPTFEGLALAAGRSSLRAGIPAVGGDVVPAESLPAGDAGLARTGVWLTIHGLVRAERPVPRPALHALSVHVHRDVLDRGGRSTTIPYSAWRFGGPTGPRVSPAVRVRVPLDSRSGLRLSIERSDASLAGRGRLCAALVRGSAAAAPEPGGPSCGALHFTIRPEPRRPRLRRGVYFLAVLDGGHAPPVWSQYEFRAIGSPDTGARSLVRTGAAGAEPMPFDYLVMTVDQPRAGEPARA